VDPPRRCILQDRSKVSFGKVAALKQEREAGCFSQGVGKAITAIEAGGVLLPLAVQRICLKSDLRVLRCYAFYLETSLLNQCVELPRSGGAMSIEHHHSGFNDRGGRNKGRIRFRNLFRIACGIPFFVQNGDQSRRVYHDDGRRYIYFYLTVCWCGEAFGLGQNVREDRESDPLDAKPAAPVSDKEAHQMFQNLLAERFHLQVHRESKTADGYTLTAPKGGGKLHRLPPDAPVGFRIQTMGQLKGPGTMDMLGRTLKGMLGAPVDDATALDGKYEIDLEWSLNETADDGKPSVFAALSERLGLVLKRSKVPVEMLIVDHAEKATPN
jgi:hypothetical protein